MIFFLLSIGTYSIAAVFHIILHRTLVRHHVRTFASVLIFAVGLMVYEYMAFTALPAFSGYEGIWFLSFPGSSSLLYILLSSLHVIFFTSPYYNEEGPSISIYFALRKKISMTYPELLALFSDRTLIIQRLSDLERGGMVTRKRNRFIITSKGNMLHSFLESYCRLLGWKSSG